MADPIRIVLADDHPVVLKELKVCVEEDRRNIVVAEAADGERSLPVFATSSPI
jgi:DNA-binding NarL/FixJ family response regulator